tara:strand:- start:1544 stop:1744 length:201 start_codon:yes stop_codon:yes gene_type:complete
LPVNSTTDQLGFEAEDERRTLSTIHDDPDLRTDTFVDEFCKLSVTVESSSRMGLTERQQILKRHGS